ncbi:MFS transporter [Nocardiopsis composta]|uniref:EmrB/QacA subfamily drug resistance transporter n=1 Tax=Nocardiopsis composta TaxID=157465 RepID=A0A7W8VFZ2_9ACTN|nr:MFS transporter [Nocardiopsis composta]MBB5435071.1 EmrB/QacA subfamily drug resistance transporter [Nocardiopsis composta]
MTQLQALPEKPAATGAAPPRPAVGRNLVLVLACAAQAVVSLDMAIVNVALPSIQHDLGFGRGGLQWVIVAYGLLLGGFLILGGRMTDRFGRRRIYLAGLAVFTGASLLAGMAGDPATLIAARALQGLGAALIVPAALSLLAVTFPEGRERNRALALFGGVGGMAASVGVVASGLLTAGPGWRWTFYINIPVGLALILLAAVFLAADPVGDRRTRLDVPGAVTITAGLLLFVYALHHGTIHGRLSGGTLALFAAAALLIAAFVRIEARAAAPLVPLSTFRNRSLVAGNVTAFLATSAFLSFIFLGSLLMQQRLGYTPAEAGLAWLATTATILPTSMIGARLAARMNVGWLMIIGLSCFTFAAIWLVRMAADAGYSDGLLVPFLCAGLGFGLCEPAIQIGALTGVPRSDAGLASGLVETTREIGGATGVAAVCTVLVIGSGPDGFRLAFAAIGALTLLSAITAAAGFIRPAHRRI